MNSSVLAKVSYEKTKPDIHGKEAEQPSFTEEDQVLHDKVNKREMLQQEENSKNGFEL